jgi:hypothetical protein
MISGCCEDLDVTFENSNDTLVDRPDNISYQANAERLRWLADALLNKELMSMTVGDFGLAFLNRKAGK